MIHFGVIERGRVTPLCEDWGKSLDWTTSTAAVSCPECRARREDEARGSSLSPIARMVLGALERRGGSAEELGRATFLPPGLVDAALAELRRAGRAEEDPSRTWRAR